MKVVLTTTRATLRGVQNEGSVVDLPAAEARRLIANGGALPYRNGAPVERTVRRTGKAPVEKASA